MLYRLMTIEDYEAMFRLWVHTSGMGLRSLDDSKEGIGFFLERNPNTSFVALLNDEIVGVILCGHDGRRGYIYHTVVKEELRGQGIAGRLIRCAEGALREEGITRICLNVLETNETGKRFWLNRGWEKREALGFYSKGITDKENLLLNDPF